MKLEVLLPPSSFCSDSLHVDAVLVHIMTSLAVTARHGTARHSTAQHSTAQHSTAQQKQVNVLRSWEPYHNKTKLQYKSSKLAFESVA